MTLLTAKEPEDIFTGPNLKKEYYALAKKYHPDYDSSPQAAELFKKLITLYELAQRKQKADAWGTLSFLRPSYVDDAGPIFKRDSFVYALKDTHSSSVAKLTSLKTALGSKHFSRYMPEVSSIRLFIDGTLQEGYAFKLVDKDVLLGGQKLKQKYPSGLPDKHIAWIASRLYEYAMFIEANNFVHAGLVPTNVYVGPEEHGIRVLNHYHLTQLGQKLTTISASYKNWYPSSVFGTKRADTLIDLEMIAHFAISLLDKSNANPQFVKWFQVPKLSAKQAFTEYRAMLEKVFGKPKYYPLEL